ncbi:MAG: hypothetical protein R6U38_01045 [Desulfatiglandaceae bacterium]
MREVEEVLCQDSSKDNYRFLALDHDIKSLRHVKTRLQDDRLQYGIANAFQIIKRNYAVAYPRQYAVMRCNPRNDFKGFGKLLAPMKYKIIRLAETSFDLIYSAGLYDYILTFDEKSKGAVALTTHLFHLLKPGGTLIIGNFSPKNPLHVRFGMEYLYDWVLIYRGEKDMYRLANGIPESDIAEMTLLEEPLGINYFLKDRETGYEDILLTTAKIICIY